MSRNVISLVKGFGIAGCVLGTFAVAVDKVNSRLLANSAKPATNLMTQQKRYEAYVQRQKEKGELVRYGLGGPYDKEILADGRVVYGPRSAWN
ncbi:hypothetical protein OAM67_01290 [bacterium]|nr:hypothetical protein [bacterium]